MTRNYL